MFEKIKNKIKPSKVLIIIAGAESSATRLFTEILSQHPKINGSLQAKKHADILDEFWEKIKREENNVKLSDFFSKNNIILTRRSYPHGTKGEAAKFMIFPPLEKVLQQAQKEKIKPIVFITTRNPLANISSWKNNRSSPEGSFQKAFVQYQKTYNDIINSCYSNSVPYYILSLEGLILENTDYINSVFQLLKLPPCKITFTADTNVNKKWY